MAAAAAGDDTSDFEALGGFACSETRWFSRQLSLARVCEEDEIGPPVRAPPDEDGEKQRTEAAAESTGGDGDAACGTTSVDMTVCMMVDMTVCLMVDITVIV